MTETAYIDMLDGVITEIPDCPTPVAEHAMRKAAIDWFQDTFLWKSELPTITTAAGIKDYPLILPTGVDLLALDSVLLPDGTPVSETFWWLDLPNMLRMDRDLGDGKVLTPTGIFSPDVRSTGIPCRFDRYIPTLEQGALGYLRDQASRPWFSPNDAAKKQQIFRAAIAGARLRKNTGNRTGSLVVRPRTFV